MKVKEAIEFVKDEVLFADDNYNEDVIKKRDEVISLLQQGEADSKKLKIVKEELKEVWQMWGEMKKYMGVNAWVPKCDFSKLKNISKISNVMNYYEQKYFPKESING